MIEQSILLKLSPSELAENSASLLRQEYLAYQSFFELQPAHIRQQLKSQAACITKALVDKTAHIRYCLPEAISVRATNHEVYTIPVAPRLRNYSIGHLVNYVTRSDLRPDLSTQLSQLERSSDPAVSNAAVLLRHALVIYMVHDYLPGGKNVQYTAEEGEDIPCVPLQYQAESRLSNNNSSNTEWRKSVGVAEANDSAWSNNVDEAGRFFLPQWVVVDNEQHLMAGDLREAVADLVAMRQYLSVLEQAVGFAPYMVVDEVYQSKHYGMLGQLVNQGRTLANYQVELLCQTIKQRAAEHRLDRGLSISLPYFNDQSLSMETHDFDVIPVGMVMFVPAFVVLAVRAQGAKVAQNTRLNQSTRKNLLKELSTIERAFLR